MKFRHHTLRPLLCACAFIFASQIAQAQTNAPSSMPATSTMPNMPNMPHGQMHKDMMGSNGMKKSMMMGMDSMNKMSMSGNTDKDFAMMMKIHHQQAVDMSEMQLAHGKSPEMKTMARDIIKAQKKEIAQFDQWLAKQK